MPTIQCGIQSSGAGIFACLTNRHHRSRAGLPVLVIWKDDRHWEVTDHPKDAVDILPQVANAGELVAHWGLQPDRTDDEKVAAQLFLGQWPEGPQIL